LNSKSYVGSGVDLAKRSYYNENALNQNSLVSKPRYYSTGLGDRLDKVNFVKLYSDADKQKLDILKENTGKSGRRQRFALPP
jgi:hypothetical protein